VKTTLLVFVLLGTASLFCATDSGDLCSIRSPSGDITINLRKLRLIENARPRDTYFYVVRQGAGNDLLYLPSRFENSIDGEHINFRDRITIHWSPLETAFVLQENVPADSPGRLHIVGTPPHSALTLIPYDTNPPANVVRTLNKHPERAPGYPTRKVVRVTDSEATIEFSWGRRTYRYADRGVPRR
jgi:hypothetical protein